MCKISYCKSLFIWNSRRWYYSYRKSAQSLKRAGVKGGPFQLPLLSNVLQLPSSFYYVPALSLCPHLRDSLTTVCVLDSVWLLPPGGQSHTLLTILWPRPTPTPSGVQPKPRPLLACSRARPAHSFLNPTGAFQPYMAFLLSITGPQPSPKYKKAHFLGSVQAWISPSHKCYTYGSNPKLV